MDQTNFSSQQEVLQAPPPPESEEPLVKPKKKLSLKIIIIIVLFSFTILAFLITFIASRRSSQEVLIPKPTPFTFDTPQTQDINEFRARLQELRDNIDAANPDDFPVAPPPLDFRLGL